jgi:formylglycine-generating enzyme required for sulfatase activity
MKLKFLPALFLLLAVSGQPARPQEAAKPLSKNQVMELVKAGMDSVELADKVKQLGIDFDLTDDYLQALRKAGAQEVLIQALRAARPTPLTRDQVLELVAGHVPSQRAAALVRQRGIDFSPDEEYLRTLRVAGAEEVLLAALREAGALVMAELLVETSPYAEVFLDGKSQGRGNFEGHLTVHATPGVHELKVSLPGKKDFSRTVTVIAKQITFAQAPLEDLAPSPGTVRKNPKDELKYVWIPPGTFMMGCSPGDNECQGNEKPAHRVTITKGFWLGQTEVTVGAYKRFAAATGGQMPPEPTFAGRPLNPAWGDDAMPMVNVNDAQAYCRWAGGRLPSEAEWEYAARAGSTAPRYGDLDEIAWHAGNSGRQGLARDLISNEASADYATRLIENGNGFHEVGQKRASALGLYDMLGNVWEWMSDWYDEKYYQSSPSQDPRGPTSGTQQVLRGGSWYNPPGVIRASHRNGGDAGGRSILVGFRCGGEMYGP